MMTKKFLNAVLCGALTLCVGTFSSCKDYDDDIDGLDNRLTTVEETTKKLQQQVEDAINNGKWIEYVEDQASEFILHFTNKNGAVESVSIPKQGADVMYYFKVAADSEGEGEGTGSQNVWWYSTDGNNWQYVLDEATHSKMVFNSTSPIKESITITSNENVSYVAVGGVQTTIMVDKSTKLLAEDKENGILVVKLGSLNYTILLEESLFRGLNSVQYRPMQASAEETLVAVTLRRRSDDSYSYEQPAWGYFRCLPAKGFDATASNVSYACQDLHVVTRTSGGELLVPEKSTASVDDHGILKIGFQPQDGFEDDTDYKTLLDVTMNGYTVSSDYFAVRKETHYLEDAVCYEQGGDIINKDDESPIVFDVNSNYPLDDKIMIGFKTGEKEEQKKSLEELGFTIRKDYTLSDNTTFQIATDKETGKQYLFKNPSAVGNEVTVTVKWTVEGKEESHPTTEAVVKFKVESLEMPLTANDEKIKLNSLESMYKASQIIELSHKGIPEEDWKSFETALNGYDKLVLRYRKMVNGQEKYLSPVEEVDGEDPLGIKLEDGKISLTVGHHASFKEDTPQQLFIVGQKGNLEAPVKLGNGKTLYVQNVKVKYAPSVVPKANLKIKVDDNGYITGDGNMTITDLVSFYGKKQFQLLRTEPEYGFGDNAYTLAVEENLLDFGSIKDRYDIKPSDLEVSFKIDLEHKLVQNNEKWKEKEITKKLSNPASGNITFTGRTDGGVAVNGTNSYKVMGGLPIKWSTGDKGDLKREGCDRWLMYDPFTFYGQDGSDDACLASYAYLMNKKADMVINSSVTVNQLEEGVVLQNLIIEETNLDVVMIAPYGVSELKQWIRIDNGGKMVFAAQDCEGNKDPYASKAQGYYYDWQDKTYEGSFNLSSLQRGDNQTTLKLKGELPEECKELSFRAHYRYDAGGGRLGFIQLKLKIISE